MAIVGPMGSMAAGYQAGAQEQRGLLDYLQRRTTAERAWNSELFDRQQTVKKEFDADVEKAVEGSQGMNPSNMGNFFDYLDRMEAKWKDAWPQRLTTRYYRPFPATASPSAGGAIPPPGLTMAGGTGGMFRRSGQPGLPQGPRKVGAPAMVPGVDTRSPMRQRGFGSPKAEQEYLQAETAATDLRDKGLLSDMVNYFMEMGGGGVNGMTKLMRDPEAFTVATQVWRARQQQSGNSLEQIDKALSQFISQQKDSMAWVTKTADDDMDQKKMRENYRKALENTIVLFFGSRLKTNNFQDVLSMLDDAKRPFALRMLEEGIDKLLDGKDMLTTEGELLREWQNVTFKGQAGEERPTPLPVLADKNIKGRGATYKINDRLMEAPVEAMFGKGSKVQYDPMLDMHIVQVPQKDGSWRFELLTEEMLDAWRPGPVSNTEKFNQILKKNRDALQQPMGGR